MKPSGNPQLEDGHTRIANELLEALLQYPFRRSELKVVLAVIRLTYGWRSISRPMKQKTLAQLTALHPRQIHRLLASLRQQGVLLRDRTTRPHRYALNKHYLGWKYAPWDPDKYVTFSRRLLGTAIPVCGLSSQPDTSVSSAPDTCVRPFKEKKERDLKERQLELAVETLLSRFRQLLRRPLTHEEQALLQRLYELSPWQAHRLVEQVTETIQQPTAVSPGGPQTNGTADGHAG